MFDSVNLKQIRPVSPSHTEGKISEEGSSHIKTTTTTNQPTKQAIHAHPQEKEDRKQKKKERKKEDKY